MTIPVRITPPSEPVISLAEVKDHARVDFSEDDYLLSTYVSAAIDHIDGYSGILGRCLVSQVWQVKLESWPAGALRLPFPDVSAIGISYVDAAEVTQQVAAADVELVEGALGTEVRFKGTFARPGLSAATDQPISVTMTAGYGAATEVPHAIKVAIMLLAAHWYEFREASGKGGSLPFGVNALLTPYRRICV